MEDFVPATVIDVHTHLAPLLSRDAVDEVDGVDTDDDGRLVIDGTRVAAPGLYDPARLAGLLAAHSIDRAWVSAPPPMYRQGLDAAATESWVHVLDAGMRARIGDDQSLGLLSYLPLDQPGVAHSLVGALAASSDVVGWAASAGGGSLPLDHASLEPLWMALEKAGKPLVLHPGESPDRRLKHYYLSNLLGNPVETAVAAGQLILGGVLSRHPRLKVVLVHCGGVLPAVVGRWTRGVATARPGIPSGTGNPQEMVRTLWTDTLAHSPAVVDLALAVFGADRLVLGSDYPFPMGVDDPFESIRHLDPDVRSMIGRNAAALLDEGTDL
ncbi:amidohydrolase family protein [Amycolatopsis lurida]